MNTGASLATKETFTQVNIQAQVAFGRKALKELRMLVKNRPNPVVINGRRYLEFCDWQILGAFFGITPYVTEVHELTRERALESVPSLTVLDLISFRVRAEARQDDKVLSATEAECLMDEQNWKGKPRFQVLSMAETRACAKVLRQCLQWVVKLPDEKGEPAPERFADEAAEEVTPQLSFSG